MENTGSQVGLRSKEAAWQERREGTEGGAEVAEMPGPDPSQSCRLG